MKRPTCFYLHEFSSQNNSAGTKLRNDVDTIFERSGFRQINHRPIKSLANHHKFSYFLSSLLASLPAAARVAFYRKQLLFFQYPIIKHQFFEPVIKKASHRNEIAFFVNDLSFFQKKYTNEDPTYTLKDEASFLSIANYLIVSSEEEKNLLQKNGVTSQIFVLDLFDYLDAPQNTKARNLSYNIAFAGFLERATFLSKVDELGLSKSRFYLYGDGYNPEKIKSAKCVYKGSFAPNDLISSINEASFGLYWDGDNPNNMEDFYGGYTKFIIPHKLSAYIMSGLPIIAWKKAAVAKTIEKLGIGITIDSLADLDDSISKISSSQYQEMRAKVIKQQSELSSGNNISSKVNEVFEAFLKSNIKTSKL